MRSASRRGLAGWQIAALAAAGSAGAVALANRLAETSAGPARSELSGEQRRFAWGFGEIAYTVKGRGAPIVLVHGVYAGASSYEYRRVFDQLAQQFRVYAFDLLGFGLSGRPAITYTPALYTQLIQDFTRQVVGGADHPVRLIASTLGAAFAIRAAAERPGLFERLVLIEPTGLEDLAENPEAPARRVVQVVLRSPFLGESLYNLIASRPSIRYFLRLTYGAGVTISDDMIDAYYTMAHQPGARYAPASFIAGTLNTPVQDAYESLRVPLLLVWGKRARFTPLERARAFRQANPRAELRVYDTGGLPQEEAPSAFVQEVGGWLSEARSPLR